MAPLTALAAYALYLRVYQYGWTPNRIIATACVVVAAFYAIGYVLAAATSGASMKALESTNVITALVIVGVLLMLRSPAADPARISVADQIHCLESGQVTPEHFDFSFLRFRAGRFGAAALHQLAAETEGPQAAAISERAKQALNAHSPYQAVRVLPPLTADTRARNITVINPSGTSLPSQFLEQDWRYVQRSYLLPRCILTDANCDALLIDLDGDGQREIILFTSPAGNAGAFKLAPGGAWEFIGSVANASCRGVREALRAGHFETEAPALKELVVEGQRLRIDTECITKAKPTSGSPAGPRPSP
jgi:hypothetical protein